MSTDVPAGTHRSVQCRLASVSRGPIWQHHFTATGALIMGKYFLGWLLGVPAIVLIIVYLIFN